jgi:choline-glycine betaine transporter
MASEMVGKVVGIGIALFVTAILLPLGLNALANASMPNVDTNVITILTVLLPVLAVIGIALYFMRNSD